MVQQLQMEQTISKQTSTEQSGPERSCIVTRRLVSAADRLRFVCGPTGALVPDLAEKLPGRGAYVSADPEIVKQAIVRQQFSRHLGEDLRDIPTVDLLIAQIQKLLATRFIQQLGLARRANLAVIGSGSMREEAWIEGLLVADDASQREARALQGSVRPDWVEAGLPAEKLGAAFGRASVAYVGLRGSTRASDEKLKCQIRTSLSRWRPFMVASACHTIG